VRDGNVVGVISSEPWALAKLNCVETNLFSLSHSVSQGKTSLSRCLKRFIIVSFKSLKEREGERKVG
jgi:hypothetical protein